MPSDRDENGRVVTKNVQVVTTITTTAKQVNIEIGSQWVVKIIAVVWSGDFILSKSGFSQLSWFTQLKPVFLEWWKAVCKRYR